jgi:hypothetical protein
LADAWAERRYLAEWLIDSSGRRLRVIFPGRRWGGPGPDFRGALLALSDGSLLRGDVEIHRRARHWIEHRHAQDPAYAQVVLHVVQVLDAPTLDAEQRPIPTVALTPERALPGSQAPPALQPPPASEAPPGSNGAHTGNRDFGIKGAWGSPRHSLGPCLRDGRAVLSVVEAAGRERFRARAARFEGDLSVIEPDQVLWRGLAEALGFARNTEPFGRLADAVPWAEAARVVVERGPVALAGLLLGTAGLIAEATLPEAHAWRALQRRLGLRVAIQAASWDRRALRAANTPVVRCRGLAEVAARVTASRTSGLAEQALDLVHEAARARRPRLWPFAWASPWIGRGRAQVVAINVLLPFAAAAGMGDAAAVFARLAGEPPNRVVRYMAAQLAAPDVRFRGACHQQGLLQLFKLTCASRLCEHCPARSASVHPLALELWT